MLIGLRARMSAMAKAISPFNAFLMICLIVLWGGSFVVVKLAMGEGLTPIALATFRFLVAGGLFAVALLIGKKLKPGYTLVVERKYLPTLLLLALTGVTLFFVIQYTGIQMAGASIASIFVCLLAPILISVFSARIFNEHLTKKQTVGIGIAASGTFTVVASGAFTPESNMTFLLGSFILLSTPFLWATYTIVGKRIMEKYDPFLIVAYVNILGGLLLLPFSLTENSFNQLFTLNLNEWSAILFLAVTCSFLGYFIWFYIMKQVEAAIASSFLFAEPLITALFAIIFAGEEITVLTLAGGILIFIGVFVVTRK